MTQYDNKAIILKLYEAVNAKDLDYIGSLGDATSQWREVPFDFTFKGARSIVDPWEAWFKIFPDATCEVQSLVGMGDYVVAQGIGRGTHKGNFESPAGKLAPGGVEMKTNFCDVYKLDGGKIVKADSYFDFYGLLAQLAPGKLNK